MNLTPPSFPSDDRLGVGTRHRRHLANRIRGTSIRLYYWNERNHEVDFVLARGAQLAAIEVKSGRRKESLPGLRLFAREFKPVKKWLVGADGLAIEECLRMEPEEFFL